MEQFVISYDVDGDAERDPQDELCNAVSSDYQADRSRCHGEREEVGRQERDVDVLREPEESCDSAQECLSGADMRLTVNIATFQQNVSTYHNLPKRSYLGFPRSLVLPVPILAALEDACVHFVADKKVGFREMAHHGVVETALVVGPGDFLFRGDQIILHKAVRGGIERHARFLMAGNKQLPRRSFPGARYPVSIACAPGA